MLLLTSLSDARIAGDMALVADNNQLAALVAETQRLVKSDAVPPLPDLQWILDRCAREQRLAVGLRLRSRRPRSQ